MAIINFARKQNSSDTKKDQEQKFVVLGGVSAVPYGLGPWAELHRPIIPKDFSGNTVTGVDRGQVAFLTNAHEKLLQAERFEPFLVSYKRGLCSR